MTLLKMVPGVLSASILLATLAVPDAIAKSERAVAKQTAREKQMGEEMKAQALAKFKVLDGTPFNGVMKRVFDRLVATPEVSSRGFNYEVFLVESDEANAYCTPGGKIFVLSGMTTVVRHDPGLWAALLGHELAHAVRSHAYGLEQKGKGLGRVRGIFGYLGSMAPGLSQAGEIARRVDQGFGIANPFLMLKFSRSDELDADGQGMMYMARAGFDPAAEITLHKELMSRFGDAKAFTIFFQTHPRESVRIEQMQSMLDETRQVVAAGIPRRTGDVSVARGSEE